jgi:hypothetical protein
LGTECLPEHRIHKSVANAIQHAWHQLWWQERRRKRCSWRNRDHPGANTLHAQVFRCGKANESGQSADEDCIASFACLNDRAQPRLSILVGNFGQQVSGVVETAPIQDVANH